MCRRPRPISVSIKKARRSPGLHSLEYYNADEVPSAESISGNYEKQKAFDVEPFRKEIIRCLEANRDNKDLKVSSIYDLLGELYVDSGYVTALPGSEQTLRNYIHFLKAKGIVKLEEPSFVVRHV
jgi:hypothetical protein